MENFYNENLPDENIPNGYYPNDNYPNGKYPDENYPDENIPTDTADPEQVHREQLERAAIRLGAAAIISTFLIPVFLPFALGSLSIVLALLSRGSAKKLSRKGRQAVILGAGAILLNLAYILYAAFTVSSLLADPSGRQQINDILYRMYGMTLEEFLSQFGVSAP